MRMMTMQRAALMGLIVLGIGVVGCTKHGDEARERTEAAQIAMGERVGFVVAAGGDAGAAPGKAPSTDPAALGKTVATNNGCVACHTPDGKTSVGPTWKGLAGKTNHALESGTVTVDDAYLKESILTPNAKLSKGFAAGLMPQTFASLKPEELDQIIAYIKSLK